MPISPWMNFFKNCISGVNKVFPIVLFPTIGGKVIKEMDCP
jgi:hypothetical protein